MKSFLTASILICLTLAACGKPVKPNNAETETAQEIKSDLPRQNKMCLDPENAGTLKDLFLKRLGLNDDQIGTFRAVLNDVIVESYDPSISKVECSGQIVLARGGQEVGDKILYAVQPSADGSGNIVSTKINTDLPTPFIGFFRIGTGGMGLPPLQPATTLTQPENVRGLIKQVAPYADTCQFATDVDEAKRAKACSAEDSLMLEIKKAGWCYGEDVDTEASKEWLPCLGSQSAGN